MRLAALALLASLTVSPASDGIETLHLKPALQMTRADLKYVKTVQNPRAVLVLCPGSNGDGERQIQDAAWQDFAKEQKLGLVGLSFASPMEAIHDGSGYYYVANGSGEKLLAGLKSIFGKDLPILLYGISGGAHFTSRFEQWKPSRVLAWCAYSAGWWDKPTAGKISPPGIVACGDEDGRYGASMIYFKQGRAAGKPWLWVSLPKTGHTGSADLDDFVRNYFSTILSPGKNTPLLVDVDQKQIVPPTETIHPALSGWIPSEKLFDQWQRIHEP
jgi:hypothetical protein